MERGERLRAWSLTTETGMKGVGWGVGATRIFRAATIRVAQFCRSSIPSGICIASAGVACGRLIRSGLCVQLDAIPIQYRGRLILDGGAKCSSL